MTKNQNTNIDQVTNHIMNSHNDTPLCTTPLQDEHLSSRANMGFTVTLRATLRTDTLLKQVREVANRSPEERASNHRNT